MLPGGGGGDGGRGVRAVGALTAAQLQLARDWSGEHELKQFLLRHYDRTTRPVRSDQTSVKVQISIALYHILDTVGFSHMPIIIFEKNIFCTEMPTDVVISFAFTIRLLNSSTVIELSQLIVPILDTLCFEPPFGA